MIDVAVIGGGHAGSAVASECSKGGLEAIIIEIDGVKPELWNGGWVEGRGVVSGPGLVSVLDPHTGDERQVIPVKAVVLAIGAIDPEHPIGRMLGATKLGVQLSADGKTVLVDHSGQTRAPGIFATGGCASTSTPYIIKAISDFCIGGASHILQSKVGS